MKTLITTLTALILSQLAIAEVSTPFQISTGNYQDYAHVASPVTFIAIAKVQPQNVENFRAVVVGLIATMRNQSGNISYDFHQSLSEQTEFVFTEEWKTGTDLAAHMESAAVAQLFAKAGSFFEPGFPKIMILKKN